MAFSPVQKLVTLRRHCGRIYYTCRRFAAWHFSGNTFCRTRSLEPLPYLHAEHRTRFLRPLKNVDMYLQENKKVNIRLASERLNGVVLRPGETFSFWRLVGLPVGFKGYKEGLVLFRGGLRKGVGGGLCQLSNLLYWMTLHTPLKVTERWRHSYDVFPDVERTQPFGSGATVAYNYVDLQIVNPTAEIFQLCLRQDDSFLYGEWRGECEPRSVYTVFEKNHRIESHSWGGYMRCNELYRNIMCSRTGVQTEEFVAANNALMMYSPLLEHGMGVTAPQGENKESQRR